MKNLMKTLILSCLALILLLTAVACARPSDDPKEAAASLKSNGYTVWVKSESEAMENGYKSFANKLKESYEIDVEEENIVEAIYAYKDSDDIVIIYFDSEDIAISVLRKIKENIVNLDDEDFVCDRSGSMIFGGTEAAIKAAK